MIKEDHPEIAELYRGGSSAYTIAKDLGIKKEYGVTENIALVCVHKAISGYKGGFNLGSYVGLIPNEEERGRLARGHIKKIDMNYKKRT
jgi:hypothetical protein